MKTENGQLFRSVIPAFVMEVPYMLNWGFSD
jgi:uncharacterized protein affecting Mg2+/Co2+ transport